ncbi:MAG: flippase [Coleofasciculaceae cyanobacterium]
MKSLLGRFDLSYIYAFLGEATLGLTFVFYIILARLLGPEEYGIFAAATALGGILCFFFQFGLPTLIAREVAANPVEGPQYTVKFLFLELLNSIPVFLFLLPIVHLLGFEGKGIIVCYLVALAEVCRSAKLTLRGVFRGMGKFRTETVAVALERSFVILLSGIVLLFTRDLVLVVATLVLGRALDIFGLLYYLNRKAHIFSPINLKSLWQSLRMAYPFALSGVLLILYYQIDLLMLQRLAPAEETGFYSAAFKIIEIFSALPRVVFLVTFTKFARCYTKEPDKLPKEIYKSISLLLAAVLPVLVIGGFCQAFLVEKLYGEAFLPSINCLAILIPSLGIKMFGNFVQYFLESTGREKYLPPILLSTVIINVIANAILIPQIGAVGAAAATLLSEIVLAVAGLTLMMRLGYYQVGGSILLISINSLLVASIPSLMLNGLNPFVGIGLLVSSIAMIVALMRPSQFLKQTSKVI